MSRYFDSTDSALYLGVPALIVVGLYAWRTHRSPGRRFLLAAFAVTFVLTLGPALFVDGHHIVSMPWTLTRHMPVLNNIQADRFAVFLALIGGVIMALWTAQTRGRVYARPFVLPVLAVAALVPNIALADYHLALQQYPFFTSGAYRDCIKQGDTIAVFPIGQPNPVEQTDAMRWQAESGFRFRLAAGYLYLYGEEDQPLTAFDDDPIVSYLHYERDRGRPTMDTLLAFVAAHRVSRVISMEVQPTTYPDATQMRRFGPVQHEGNLLISPACNSPSLLTRNLTPYVRQFAAEKNTIVRFCSGNKPIELPYGLDPTGNFAGATPALMVKGVGLQCTAPTGYRRQGFATAATGVPPNTYPYYAP